MTTSAPNNISDTTDKNLSQGGIAFLQAASAKEFINSQPKGTVFCTYVSSPLYLNGELYLTKGGLAAVYISREEALLFVDAIVPPHLVLVGCTFRVKLQIPIHSNLSRIVYLG